MESTKSYDLEERLINFSVSILNLLENMPQSFGAMSLSKQLARSGTSPALNYGEAQAAESGKDFIHKMKICLKELRESQICLKIIQRKPYLPDEKVTPVLDECSQLVAIFTKSISTKTRNMNNKDRK